MSKNSYTPEEFIERAQKVHDSFYDYSKVQYTHSKIKVQIICPEHGAFYQLPCNHLLGRGCFPCGVLKRRYTLEEFIKKAKLVHGDGTYNYEKVIYKNIFTKICIVCPIHGDFIQLPSNHILKKARCPKCFRIDLANQFRLTTEEFIKESIAVHGEGTYDYSKVVYENAHKHVCIICDIHGEFWQNPQSHKTGNGCLKCLNLTTEEFILRANLVHGEGTYDYSKVVYIKSRAKVCIICEKHGEFWQKAGAHLRGNRCPSCNYISKGETSIKNFLKENGIDFNQQYSYLNLKGPGNHPLKFDFYIPSINLLIEFDGTHHFKPVRFHGMSLETSQSCFERISRNDDTKNKYCLENKIPLLRIGYKDFKRIPEILSEHLLTPMVKVA